MIIRVGLPKRTGEITRTVAQIRLPVMFSANAFRGRRGFVRPSATIQGMDAALDSAGFVAMARYGGFPWSPAEYIELAAAAPWKWWASMDLCCEPEIARCRVTVGTRMTETVRLYHELAARAGDIGISGPVPVIQGWLPDDYRKCADAIGELPGLVGIGSICRRNTRGVVAIVTALDQWLSEHVRFHLFGVKGEAAFALRHHPRIASIDSMAWDFDARYAPGRNSNEKRLQHLLDWRQRLAARLAEPKGAEQLELPA